MLNQIVLVGRIVKFSEENDTTIVSVAVPRSFKSSEGIYETDFIDCILIKGIAENTKEYCKNGDIIGIKGRIQRIDVEDNIQLIAEKVTFLSTGKEESEEA